MISANSSKIAEKVLSKEIYKLRNNVLSLRPFKHDTTKYFGEMWPNNLSYHKKLLYFIILTKDGRKPNFFLQLFPSTMKMIYVHFNTNILDMSDMTTIVSLSYVEKNCRQKAQAESSPRPNIEGKHTCLKKSVLC